MAGSVTGAIASTSKASSPTGSNVPSKRSKGKGKASTTAAAGAAADSSDEDEIDENGRKRKRHRMALACHECKVSLVDGNSYIGVDLVVL
jgi:hypothetical protein